MIFDAFYDPSEEIASDEDGGAVLAAIRAACDPMQSSSSSSSEKDVAGASAAKISSTNVAGERSRLFFLPSPFSSRLLDSLGLFISVKHAGVGQAHLSGAREARGKFANCTLQKTLRGGDGGGGGGGGGRGIEECGRRDARRANPAKRGGRAWLRDP